jgi:hypothetical protein
MRKLILAAVAALSLTGPSTALAQSPVTPSNGATYSVDEPMTFSWVQTEEAVAFRVIVSTSPNLTCYSGTAFGSPETSATSITVTPASMGLWANAKWYWRVCYRWSAEAAPDGWSDTSHGARSFTTAPDGGDPQARLSLREAKATTRRAVHEVYRASSYGTSCTITGARAVCYSHFDKRGRRFDVRVKLRVNTDDTVTYAAKLV